MSAPTVFVASSGESQRLAQAIQQNLKTAEVRVWTQDAFHPGQTLIDELQRNLKQSDFGVFIFAGDDEVKIRGQKYQAVRDNVILELGMFIGLLGKDHSFIVKPENADLRLPTDLQGVVAVTYNKEWAQREPVPALGSACTQIDDAIKRQYRRKSKELSTAISESLETICWSMSAPLTPERASLRAFIFKKEREELVCVGFWDPYESVEQVGKTRFHIDEKTASKVIVVRCFLDNALHRSAGVEGGAVAPLTSRDGVKGAISPSLRYVLASPIRNTENDSIWGVVDFDASNNLGKKLLQNEQTANAVIWRLSRDLAKILAR